MEEIWKDVIGFEGLYQVSNLGRLRHFSRKNWQVLKNTNKKGGYLSVVLRSKSGNKSTRIHRLVAEAFISNPNNKPQVNHIDGNKQNNRVDNLEWVTQKENFEHARQSGLWKYNKPYLFTKKHIQPKTNEEKNKMEKHYISIQTDIEVCQFSLEGDYIATYSSCAEASRQTGICQRNITRVAYKEEFNKEKHLVRKQAGGFVWKLKKEVMI